MLRSSTVCKHNARSTAPVEMSAHTMSLPTAPHTQSTSSCFKADDIADTDAQGSTHGCAENNWYPHTKQCARISQGDDPLACAIYSNRPGAAICRGHVEQISVVDYARHTVSPAPAVEALQVIDRLRWWRLCRVSEQPLPPHHYIFSGNYFNYSAFGTRPLSSRLIRLIRQPCDVVSEADTRPRRTATPIRPEQLDSVPMNRFTTEPPCTHLSHLHSSPDWTAQRMCRENALRVRGHRRNSNDNVGASGGDDNNDRAKECYCLAQQKMCDKRAALNHLRWLFRPRAFSAPVTRRRSRYPARSDSGAWQRNERSALHTAIQPICTATTPVANAHNLTTIRSTELQTSSRNNNVNNSIVNHHPSHYGYDSCIPPAHSAQSAMHPYSALQSRESLHAIHTALLVSPDKDRHHEERDKVGARNEDDEKDVRMGAPVGSVVVLHSPARLVVYNRQSSLSAQSAVVRSCMTSNDLANHECAKDSAEVFALANLPLYSFEKYFYTEQLRIIYEVKMIPLPQTSTPSSSVMSTSTCETIVSATQRLLQRDSAPQLHRMRGSYMITHNHAMHHSDTAPHAQCSAATITTRSVVASTTAASVSKAEEQQQQQEKQDDDDNDDENDSDYNAVKNRTASDSRAVSLAHCNLPGQHTNAESYNSNNAASDKSNDNSSRIVPCVLHWRARRRAASVPSLPLVSYNSCVNRNNRIRNNGKNRRGENETVAGGALHSDATRRFCPRYGQGGVYEMHPKQQRKECATHAKGACDHAVEEQHDSMHRLSCHRGRGCTTYHTRSRRAANMYSVGGANVKDDETGNHCASKGAGIHAAVVDETGQLDDRDATAHKNVHCTTQRQRQDTEQQTLQQKRRGRGIQGGHSHDGLCRDVDDLQDVFVFNATVDCIGRGAFSRVYAAIPIFHRVGGDGGVSQKACTNNDSIDTSALTANNNTCDDDNNNNMASTRAEVQLPVVAIKVIPRKAKRRASFLAPPDRAGPAVNAPISCATVAGFNNKNEYSRYKQSSAYNNNGAIIIRHGANHTRRMSASDTAKSYFASAVDHVWPLPANSHRTNPERILDRAEVAGAYPCQTATAGSEDESSQRRELVEIEREIAVLRGLRHTGCSLFYEALRTRDEFVIAMELHPDSVNLRQLLTRFGLLSESRVALLLLQLLETVDYLHNTFGLIHRDIKLENLLVSRVQVPEDVIVQTLGPHVRKAPPNANSQRQKTTSTSTLATICANHGNDNTTPTTNSNAEHLRRYNHQAHAMHHGGMQYGNKHSDRPDLHSRSVGRGRSGCADRYQTLGSTPDSTHACSLLRLTLIDFGLSRRTHISGHIADHACSTTATVDPAKAATMHTRTAATAAGTAGATLSSDPVRRNTSKRRSRGYGCTAVAIPTPLPSTNNLFSAFYDVEDESVTVGGLCSTDVSTRSNESDSWQSFCASSESSNTADCDAYHVTDSGACRDGCDAGNANDGNESRKGCDDDSGCDCNCDGDHNAGCDENVNEDCDDADARRAVRHEKQLTRARRRCEAGRENSEARFPGASCAPEQPPWLIAAVSQVQEESNLPAAPTQSAKAAASAEMAGATDAKEERVLAEARLTSEAHICDAATSTPPGRSAGVAAPAAEAKSRSYSCCSKSAGFAVSQRQQHSSHSMRRKVQEQSCEQHNYSNCLHSNTSNSNDGNSHNNNPGHDSDTTTLHTQQKDYMRTRSDHGAHNEDMDGLNAKTAHLCISDSTSPVRGTETSTLLMGDMHSRFTNTSSDNNRGENDNKYNSNNRHHSVHDSKPTNMHSTNISYSYSAATDDEDTILLLTPCGTEKYMAPEMLEWIVHRDYTRRPASVAVAKKMDVYAIGIVAYVLLSGCFPFNATSSATLAQQQRRIPRCNSANWHNVSSEAIGFVQGLLRPDPQDRLTVKEALQHPFMQSARHAAEKLDLMPHPYDRERATSATVATLNAPASSDDHCNTSSVNGSSSAAAGIAAVPTTVPARRQRMTDTKTHNADSDHSHIHSGGNCECSGDSSRNHKGRHTNYRTGSNHASHFNATTGITTTSTVNTTLGNNKRTISCSINDGDGAAHELGRFEFASSTLSGANSPGLNEEGRVRSLMAGSSGKLVGATQTCVRPCSALQQVPAHTAVVQATAKKSDSLVRQEDSSNRHVRDATNNDKVAVGEADLGTIDCACTSKQRHECVLSQSHASQQTDDDDLFAQLYFNIMSADG